MTTPEQMLAAVARDVLQDVTQAALLELSWGTERHVRTEGGVQMYNMPIGSLITFHARKLARERHGTKAEAAMHAKQESGTGTGSSTKSGGSSTTGNVPGQPPPYEAKQGAAAIHPGVKSPITRAGDTISGLAYKHTPKPSPFQQQPVEELPQDEPQIKELIGPGKMRGRVNPDGSVETLKWDGSWGPAVDPEHIVNTWLPAEPGQQSADSTQGDVGKAMLDHFTGKAEAAAAKRYTEPTHAGPLTDDEVNDRLDHVERSVSDAMHAHKSTDRKFSSPGGVWNPGRATQHNAIVKTLMKKYADVPQEGKAVIAGGVPGAGKSTVLKSLPDKYMPIDADEIKGEMAARGMVPKVKGLSPMEAAPLVHEESRHIASLLAHRAYAEHRNVAWDITMAGPNSPNRHIDDMTNAGYGEVKGVYVHADPKVAIARTESRYREGLEAHRTGEGLGGRYISPATITGNAAGSHSVFNGLKHRFASTEEYDTSKGKPELTETYKPLSDDEFAGHAHRAETAVAAAISKGKETYKTQTTDRKGMVYKPERAAQHKEIVDHYVRHAIGVPSNGHGIIAGGPPGSGKSQVLKQHPGINVKKFVHIDTDDIKKEMAKRKMIPEVPGLTPLEAAPLAHIESQQIAGLVAHEMYRRHKNVIIHTATSSPLAAKHVAAMRKAGYGQVGAIYTEAQPEVALARTQARYRSGLEQVRRGGSGPGGRAIPSGVVRQAAGGKSKAAFEKLKPQLDWWTHVEGSKSQPQLIAQKGEHKEARVLSVEDMMSQLNARQRESLSTEQAARKAEEGK